MTHFTADVTGMHCAGCAITVEQALKSLPGVRAVSVDHRRGVANFEADHGPELGDIEGALRTAGFRLGAVSRV